MNMPCASNGFRQAFATATRALRAERGWTQRELCRRAEVSPGYLSELESGRKDPSPDTLLRLANAFGLSMEHLLWAILAAVMTGETPGVHRRDSAMRIARESLTLSPQDRTDLEQYIQFLNWKRTAPQRIERNKNATEIVDDTEPTDSRITEDG